MRMRPQPYKKDPDPFPADVVKHLEMVQAVISRLASNSFLIKGWALTATGVFYGLAVNKSSWNFALLGAVAALMFWFLDSYYLRQERLYRRLYESVRSQDGKVPHYSLNASGYQKRETRTKSFFSTTLVSLYSMVSGLGFVICSFYVNYQAVMEFFMLLAALSRVF
ncbi:hypothetical protein ABT332_00015 [Saccharomonospora azurea]|uniref:hypothetical protein n=1 Tax=Saccharomonospora azurea TaxID=40988 RepID=UPI00331AD935